MKTLADGTNVRAILWYLALEYRDSLLQENIFHKPVHDMNKAEFVEFCKIALEKFSP